VLSGMSDWDQLKDNLRIFEDASMNCMSAEEKQLMEDVKKAYLARMKTGCTGCRYCQPCPRNVHIPDIFRAWDESLMFDRPDILKNRMKQHIDAKEDPSQCIECGMCEGACPQHLSIIDLLKQAAEAAKLNIFLTGDRFSAFLRFFK
jgi:predicted aldo/keto reductase-like oxidoreductase